MPLKKEGFLSALPLTSYNPLDKLLNLSQQIKQGNFDFLEIKIFCLFFSVFSTPNFSANTRSSINNCGVNSRPLFFVSFQHALQ